MWENEYACLPSVSFRVPSSLNIPPRDHYSLRSRSKETTTPKATQKPFGLRPAKRRDEDDDEDDDDDNHQHNNIIIVVFHVVVDWIL